MTYVDEKVPIKERVETTIKPVVIVKEVQGDKIKQIELPRPSLLVEKECADDFFNKNYFHPFRFKETNSQTKFYRRIFFGSANLTKYIFKEGLNAIVLDRSDGYSKSYHLKSF